MASNEQRVAVGQSLVARRSLLVASGFTMVELLVVIAIIALLAGLLLVGVNRLYRQGGRLKSAGDLQAIATALEAYKGDFGDYPRVPDENTGAAILCRALIGPSPKPKPTGPWARGEVFRQTPTSLTSLPRAFIALADTMMQPAIPQPVAVLDDDWAPYEPRDGADGNFAGTPSFEFEGEQGFRNGPKTVDKFTATGQPGEDGAPDTVGGRVYGPYLPADKFKVAKDTGFILDGNGNPILYFPASAVKPAISKVTAGQQSTALFVTGGPQADVNPSALFNANHNIRFFMRKPAGASALETMAVERARARIRAMLGDYGVNGALDKQAAMESETSAADSLPFLLWTAGPDGVFGPEVDAVPGVNEYLNITPTDAAAWKSNQKAVEACDDIANFR